MNRGPLLLLPLTRCLSGIRAAVPSPDSATIHQKLAEILARPEFRQHLQNLSWLARVLKDFFAWLGSLYDNAPGLFWLILGVCVTLLLLLLAHIIWTARQAFATGEAAVDAREAAERRQRLSHAYQQQALDRAAQGEYTEAIRFLFLSLVYRFDEEGRVLFQRAYTNREYLTLFADRPGVNEDLRVFVDTLDDHWYGQQPSDAGRYQECLSLYERLRRQA
jgi:tetratricopeptide (TPR) repeat protein